MTIYWYILDMKYESIINTYMLSYLNIILNNIQVIKLGKLLLKSNLIILFIT